jgi:hypothetical protein
LATQFGRGHGCAASPLGRLLSSLDQHSVAPYGNWVWIFALFPEDGTIRLVSRIRIATPNAPAVTRLLGVLVWEPGSLVMERKMLLGDQAAS